ncbi:hypothetical protein HOU02_gp244 [Caulobacter phage CcrBL9]|uniref:Uncharacterized protein n=1 Tax=Caulobacter phage CcrBL9 TaxID=2283270 RepID=A0A385EC73_9CAUD|nr:hypothetical protein HOU02_gp244 [Caulobacter phage CcrBL9]AXQ69481.1 hypothetical protein CcrBL9_gp457 [Caulobacter phage CcrBL9]
MMSWPETYSLTREEMLAFVKQHDAYSEAFRSAFLGILAASASDLRVNILGLSRTGRRADGLCYLGHITGADERLLIRCFHGVRFGDTPPVLTEEGSNVLHFIAQFYPDEINDHIGPFSKVYAHLRAPPKPKAEKKPKKDKTDVVV